MTRADVAAEPKEEVMLGSHIPAMGRVVRLLAEYGREVVEAHKVEKEENAPLADQAADKVHRGQTHPRYERRANGQSSSKMQRRICYNLSKSGATDIL